MNHKLFFVLGLLLLAACGGEETAVSPPTLPPSTSAPTSTTMATEVATLVATSPPPSAPTTIPTAMPTVTVAATEIPETAVSGRDASGSFFYGNPNADVVLIDFSDFL